MQRRVLHRVASFTLREMSTTSEKVSFGSRDVDPEEKSELIKHVFRNVADRYDLMNDVMSGGLHRLWKNYYVSQIPLSQNGRHLDSAGGTGDIAFRLADRMESGSIVVCDLSLEMIENGKRRSRDRDHYRQRLEWIVGDAQSLPFPDKSFDSYSIAFGIRNTTHVDVVLREAYRVLKPGGYFSCLEFSHIDNPVLRLGYDLHSMVIPWLGQLIVGDGASYRYLVESIRRFPKQVAFSQMIVDAGFRQVTYENLMGGIVAIHSGRVD